MNSQTGKGVLATIYIDRVNWMAEQAGVDAGALLGRAIAHELGHLLMATGAHGSNGLMRPVWSQSEIRRRQIDDWISGRERSPRSKRGRRRYFCELPHDKASWAATRWGTILSVGPC